MHPSNIMPKKLKNYSLSTANHPMVNTNKLLPSNLTFPCSSRLPVLRVHIQKPFLLIMFSTPSSSLFSILCIHHLCSNISHPLAAFNLLSFSFFDPLCRYPYQTHQAKPHHHISKLFFFSCSIRIVLRCQRTSNWSKPVNQNPKQALCYFISLAFTHQCSNITLHHLPDIYLIFLCF